MSEFETTEIAVEPSGDSAQVESGESMDQELEAIWDNHLAEGGARDESDPAASPAQAEDQTQAEGVDQGNAADPAADVPDAPHAWTNEEKEAWKAAPPKVREALERRAQEVEEYVRQHQHDAEFARIMRPIGKVIAEDLREYLQQSFWDDGRPLWGNPELIAEEIKALLSFKHEFMNNPQQAMTTLSEWANQNGLDLGLAAQPDQQWQDPRVTALRAELAQMRGQLQRQEQEALAEKHDQRQREAVLQVARHVNGLSEETGPGGEKKYPHLHGEHAQAVGEAMGKYIRANATQGITPQLFTTAYDVAVFAHPVLREAEFKAREEARLAQYRANSARAKNAAGIRPSPSGSGSAREEFSDPDAAMEAVWKKYTE